MFECLNEVGYGKLPNCTVAAAWGVGPTAELTQLAAPAQVKWAGCQLKVF